MSRSHRQTTMGRRLSANRVRWSGLAAIAAVATVGVGTYLSSSAHELHDPHHGLQQLDLLYLNEPAPGLQRLPVTPHEPVVLVFCADDDCPLPVLEIAQVVRSTNPVLAARYALRREDGRVGPGYVLIDASGQVRYRTFDPGLAAHETEIRLLVEGMS